MAESKTRNGKKSASKDETDLSVEGHSSSAGMTTLSSSAVSMADIEKLIAKTVSKTMAIHEEKLMKILDERISALNGRFVEIETSLESCYERIAVLEQNINTTEDQLRIITRNTVDVEQFQRVTRKIETDLNDLEQYGRRFNIRIFGLSLANDEDCKEKVATLISESLGMSSFATDDIEAAHPLPVRKVKSASSGTHRQTASLIVRLRSKSTR